jgi:gliding motility-associated-like protein
MNEGGVFNPKVDYPSGSGYQTEVELADINGDGNLDILTSSSGNQIFILEGNGSGGFGTAKPFTVGNVPYGITVGDFDEDSKPDVAVSNFNDGTVCVLLTSPTSIITITQQPVNPNNVCEGGNYVLSTDATGTTNIAYKWQKFNAGTSLFEDLVDDANYAGVNTKNLTITNANSALAGDYRCMINGDLASTVYCNVSTLIVNVKPPNPVVTNAERCGLGSVTLTASGGAPGEFIWRTDPAVGEPIQNENDPTYTTPSLSTTTTYYVSVANSFCESNRVPVIATILSTPLAPTTTSLSNCGPGSLILQANGGTNGQYRWYDIATGGTAFAGEVNNTFTTPALTTTTTYYVSINNGTCEGPRSAVTAAINNIPNKPTITSSELINSGVIELCLQPITLSAPAGFTSYTWSTGQTTQQVTITQPGFYSVSVTDVNGCTSIVSDVIQIVNSTTCVNNAPVINTTSLQTFIGGKVTLDLTALISDPDDNLDPASLQAVNNSTQKGGKTTFNGFILEIDYSSAKFSGKDLVTIRVCDLLNVCFEATFEIDVIGDIVVYNGISPNGDTKNDTWEIEYITLFPDTQNNRVTIYNRWGDVVWEASNYDNNNVVFTGLNKNGSELSTGTYFYKIEFTGGRETISGYLSLKK